MIQPAKVNFNRAMFVVVLVFGLVSTLILLSDPLNPENEEIPTVAKKTSEEMFATLESSIGRSNRWAPNSSNDFSRTPASTNSKSQEGFVAPDSLQKALENPFGVNSPDEGFDIDCSHPPSEPLPARAARIKIQLSHCDLEDLKIKNISNGFEGTLLPIGAKSAVTDLIGLYDQNNDFEVTGKTANFKFKILNSLPKK